MGVARTAVAIVLPESETGMSARKIRCNTDTKRRNITDDEVWQVEHISSYCKTERACYWVARRFEQNRMRIYALSAVLKSVGSEILPVFNHRLVFE